MYKLYIVTNDLLVISNNKLSEQFIEIDYLYVFSISHNLIKLP